MEPLVVNEYTLDANRSFLLMERVAQLTIPGTCWFPTGDTKKFSQVDHAYIELSLMREDEQ